MEKFKEFLIKTEEFLTKNWKVMLISLAVLLLMGQCSSCSRDNRVEKRNAEITVLNNKVDSLVNECNHLKTLLDVEQSHNSDFTNIATGNQADLLKQLENKDAKIKELEAQIKSSTAKIKELEASIKSKDALIEAYKQDNIRLNKELVDSMEKQNNTK